MVSRYFHRRKKCWPNLLTGGWFLCCNTVQLSEDNCSKQKVTVCLLQVGSAKEKEEDKKGRKKTQYEKRREGTNHGMGGKRKKGTRKRERKQMEQGKEREQRKL